MLAAGLSQARLQQPGRSLQRRLFLCLRTLSQQKQLNTQVVSGASNQHNKDATQTENNVLRTPARVFYDVPQKFEAKVNTARMDESLAPSMHSLRLSASLSYAELVSRAGVKQETPHPSDVESRLRNRHRVHVPQAIHHNPNSLRRLPLDEISANVVAAHVRDVPGGHVLDISFDDNLLMAQAFLEQGAANVISAATPTGRAPGKKALYVRRAQALSAFFPGRHTVFSQSLLSPTKNTDTLMETIQNSGLMPSDNFIVYLGHLDASLKYTWTKHMLLRNRLFASPNISAYFLLSNSQLRILLGDNIYQTKAHNHELRKTWRLTYVARFPLSYFTHSQLTETTISRGQPISAQFQHLIRYEPQPLPEDRALPMDLEVDLINWLIRLGQKARLREILAPLQIPLKTLRASGYDEKALLTEVDLKQLVNDFVYWPKIDKWEDMVTGGLTMEDYLQTNADDD